MIKTKYLLIPILLTLSLSSAVAGPNHDHHSPDKARHLVQKMVEAVGTIEKFRSLNDVEYTYVYRENSSGKEDVSTERYVFDGELSWAKYSKREKLVAPDKSGEVIQGFDGKHSWVTINGELLQDPKLVKQADFLRKTNYYWFTMMFKLLDPGLIYSYEGTQEVNGVNYEKVKVAFQPGIGDVSDIYVLYINPQTYLVDQFLFTVMDFNMKDPLLMVIDYEEVDGVKLPARRKYTASNWQAEVLKDEWTDEIMTDIRFNNRFSETLFQNPMG